MVEEQKNIHVIDTRFTWSGERAKEFLELVKEDYGLPLPYGAVNQFIRLICVKYIETHRKENNEQTPSK